MTQSLDLSSLHVSNIVADYGSTVALSGVSATFPRGSVTALTGGNGSGKSTLLGIIAGTIEPRSGRVTGGSDDSSVSSSGSRRSATHRPAYVVQRSQASDALPLTVVDVVSMGRWAERGAWRRPTARDRTIVDETMEVLGIRSLARRPIGSLSGGQRQRALVAQGLARRAHVLLLDEATAGVDAHARELINRAVRAEAERGAVVIHATHERSVIEHSDHVLRLERGAIASSALRSS